MGFSVLFFLQLYGTAPVGVPLARPPVLRVRSHAASAVADGTWCPCANLEGSFLKGDSLGRRGLRLSILTAIALCRQRPSESGRWPLHTPLPSGSVTSFLSQGLQKDRNGMGPAGTYRDLPSPTLH